MAATFVNLETQKAYRILSTEASRDAAAKYAPNISDPHMQQLEAYKIMPLSELFEVKEVSVNIKDSDMPGPAGYKKSCDTCGIVIRDAKEVKKGDQSLCHACAGQSYYRELKTIRI